MKIKFKKFPVYISLSKSIYFPSDVTMFQFSVRVSFLILGSLQHK